ncbi:MAG: hypothetical protein JXA77_18165 [Bacteroidales bacterium]|nr:hypothetical protein [Bacteroidales bacterium]MBN2818110.1 hypothetical protein [Bacteroidales bacterium]
MIFKSNLDYLALGDSYKTLALSSIKCVTAKLTEIDFDTSSLIGKYSEGGSCDVTRNYNLEIDSDTKDYRYTISKVYDGSCNMLFFSMNWALVPAIPDDYMLEFVVNNGMWLVYSNNLK